MADEKTTQALAAAVGSEKVAAELRRKIHDERVRIRAEVAGFHAKQPVAGPDPLWRLNHPKDVVKSLGHNFRAVLKAQAELAGLDPSEQVPSASEEARAVFEALTSGGRGGEVLGWLAYEWHGYKRIGTKKLAELESSIAWINSQFGERGFEESKARLAEVLKDQAKYRRQLDTIGYDAEDYPRKAAAAIEAAGGLEHIALCVKASWQLASKWLEADPSFATLQAQREKVAEIEASLARIDSETILAFAIHRQRDAAAAQVEATVQAMTERRQAAAKALVARAASADEAAIKELTGLAAGCVDAFPEKFAAAFDCLRPSEQQLVGALEVKLIGEA
jgi:hypothetical protein